MRSGILVTYRPHAGVDAAKLSGSISAQEAGPRGGDTGGGCDLCEKVACADSRFNFCQFLNWRGVATTKAEVVADVAMPEGRLLLQMVFFCFPNVFYVPWYFALLHCPVVCLCFFFCSSGEKGGGVEVGMSHHNFLEMDLLVVCYSVALIYSS